MALKAGYVGIKKSLLYAIKNFMVKMSDALVIKSLDDTLQLSDDGELSVTISGGGIDYSTTEVKTGSKWYDGKDIYCKVIEYDTPRNLPQSGEITFEPTEYVETLLDVRFFRKAAEGVDPWYISPGGVGFKTSTGKLDVRNTVSLNNFDTMLIYYTKKDDLAE